MSSEKVLDIKSENVPYWVKEPEKLSPFEAIGMSPVNFQGMYIQRSEAITQAREKLSQRIHAYVKSVEEKKLRAYNSQVQKSYKSTTEVITKLLLNDSYQADAYIDPNNTLYVLVRVKSTSQLKKILGNEFTPKVNYLSSLKTSHFSIEPLLERRCYNENILRQLITKYPMYHNKPIWFYRPNYKNKYIADIGIAEQVSDTEFIKQKDMAEMLAKSSIAKRMNTQINSYNRFQKVVLHNELGETFDWYIKTQSRTKVDDVTIKDIWMNPVNCELYIWAIKK